MFYSSLCVTYISVYLHLSMLRFATYRSVYLHLIIRQSVLHVGQCIYTILFNHSMFHPVLDVEQCIYKVVLHSVLPETNVST